MSVKLSVESLYNGGVSEILLAELKKVVDNILDPNTEAKKERSVTLKMKIKPNEGRNMAEMKIETTSKICPVAPIETSIMIAKNLKTGEVFCEEICSGERIEQNSFEGTNNVGKLASDLQTTQKENFQ